jgi:hypothetical protein
VQAANAPESIEHSVVDPASELNAILKLEFLEYAAVFAITGEDGAMLSTVKLYVALEVFPAESAE